jgi:hypothetical protein
MRIVGAGLVSGLVGGALDMLAASTIYPWIYGVPVARIWQSVAAGVLGREAARAGGAETALLGLGLHYFIALCAGLVLAAAMAAVSVSRRYALATGAIFGVSMYFFMQKIVIPLSKATPQNPDASGLAVGLAIHIFIFGIPMALVARRLLERGKA